MESVVITDTTGGRVCLECSFYSFSTDTGCTVELVSSDSSSSVQYTETISRSGNGNAKGCVSGITRGQYISVYDQSSHMLFETFTGVNVTGETTTTTTTPVRTTISTTASTHGTRDSTSTIAGKYKVTCFVSILKIIHVVSIKCLMLTVIIIVYMIVYTDYIYLH